MKIFIFLSLILFLSLDGSSQNNEINLSKGKDASSRKEYNLAITYFNQVLQEDPNNLEAYSERAHACNMLGDYKKAIEDYNFVLKKDPNCAKCYFGLGTIYDTWLDDNYGAIEYFTKVIDVSLKGGNREFAGVGYFMRADQKNKLGDNTGYMEDIKKGAALNNPVCKSILEMEQKICK